MVTDESLMSPAFPKRKGRGFQSTTIPLIKATFFIITKPEAATFGGC